ncbi:WXG100 family type VII secretion target, partial [Nocardia sp. NPDC058497]|uniref:WXG100 family type VII secretion target n=1 Tax=Nocardia sp. NPDC058497 TaxID=3346529 RepID=UPI00364DC954
MVENAQPFKVDLSELEQVTTRVAGFKGFLDDSLDGLQQRIAAIQQNWTGQAADAQAPPMPEWGGGGTDFAHRLEIS